MIDERDDKIKKDVDVKELSDDDIQDVTGGTMHGNIVTNQTTDISEDTKDNI